MIYPIVAYGHPVLKKKARDIEGDSEELHQLIADMFETMYNANGIGLAAPQIGKDIRLFVTDGSPLEDESMKDFKKVFINPEIIEEDGDDWPYEEGCLSIPGVHEEILRAEELTIRYFDEKWQEKTERFSGMKARIIQHEYDHIEGVLFIDHLSGFKKRLLKSRLTNISKGAVSVSYRMIFPDRK